MISRKRAAGDDGARPARNRGGRSRFATLIATALVAGAPLGAALTLPSVASAGNFLSGGAGGGGVPTPKLPADFPTAELPLPAGTLTSASDNPTQHGWNVTLLIAGRADIVHQQTLDFYTAHGFTADITPTDNSTLHNARFVITFIAATTDTSGTDPFDTLLSLQIASASGASGVAPAGTSGTSGAGSSTGSTTGSSTPSHHRKVVHHHRRKHVAKRVVHPKHPAAKHG